MNNIADEASESHHLQVGDSETRDIPMTSSQSIENYNEAAGVLTDCLDAASYSHLSVPPFNSFDTHILTGTEGSLEAVVIFISKQLLDFLDITKFFSLNE